MRKDLGRRFLLLTVGVLVAAAIAGVGARQQANAAAQGVFDACKDKGVYAFGAKTK